MQLTDRISEIQLDMTSGASQLARKTLDTLEYFAQQRESKTVKEFKEDMKELGIRLLKTKPGMAPIQNAAAQIVYEINASEEHCLDSLRKFAKSRIDELRQEFTIALEKAAKWGATIISNSDHLTTCSYSSTVYETLRAAKNQGKTFKVYVPESRSEDNNLQHGQTLATILKSTNIPAKIFPDNEIHKYIRMTKTVIVGADSLLCDGSLINGTPTLEVALKAKEHNIPFYSVCETAKVNALSYMGKRIELEKGFELIPSNLITAIITEKGLLTSNMIAKIAKEKSKFLESIQTK
jgi:translation initiation factor eIF-2B subunit delta